MQHRFLVTFFIITTREGDREGWRRIIHCRDSLTSPYYYWLSQAILLCSNINFAMSGFSNIVQSILIRPQVGLGNMVISWIIMKMTQLFPVKTYRSVVITGLQNNISHRLLARVWQYDIHVYPDTRMIFYSTVSRGICAHWFLSAHRRRVKQTESRTSI